MKRCFSLLTVLMFFNFGGLFAVQTAYQVHLVKKKETLGEIAKEYYGSSKLYKRIAQANNIKPPYKILIGQELIIPFDSSQGKISEKSLKAEKTTITEESIAPKTVIPKSPEEIHREKILWGDIFFGSLFSIVVLVAFGAYVYARRKKETTLKSDEPEIPSDSSRYDGWTIGKSNEEQKEE